MKISIVVPIYNEEKNLKELHSEIFAVCQKNNYDVEIIFINDGSTDNSLAVMKTLGQIKIINLRKNFGQTAAMSAGLEMAQGEIIITMDGDLQNNPADIPLLLVELDKGFDVVSGWRKERHDPLKKRVLSKLANLLRLVLINDGINDSGCTLKAYKQECFEEVELYSEMHRFIPALLKMRGFKISEVIVNHRPRLHGESKYGWDRLIKGILDMLSVWFWKKYSGRPLHLFGAIGLFLSGISFLGGVYAGYQKFFFTSRLVL